MSKTLEQLKAQGKVAAWYDFRSGSLLDSSGNGNTLTLVGSGGAFHNGLLGKNVLTQGTRYFAVSDNASIRLSGKGSILMFGDFTYSNAGQVFLAKRDGEGCNYQVATGAGTLELYDGVTSGLVFDITNSKFLGITLSSSSTKPLFYKDGAYAGTGSAASTLPSGTQTLYIGQYGCCYNRNAMYMVVILNDTITAQQMASIYSEFMAERGAGDPKPTNFHAPPFQDAGIAAKTVLHWDMNTRTGDGKMADLSGNGRHGTISNAQKAFKAPFDCTKFNGADASNILLANGFAAISGNDAHAIDFWVNLASITNRPIILGTSSGNYFVEINSSGALYWFINAALRKYNAQFPVMDAWYHVHLEKTGAGDSGNAYVNNVLLTPSSGTIGTTPSAPTNTLQVGSYAAGATYGLNGAIADLRLFSSNLTTAERTALYNYGAKRLVLNLPMGNETNATLDSVTSGLVSNTPWERVSGTWAVEQDAASPYKKWLKCVVAGIVGIKSTKAYGTWVFDVYHAENSVTDILFIASDMAARDGATQSAYTLELIPSERIQLEKNTPGTSTDLTYTAPLYFAAETAYRFVITRKYNGQFSVYIKGGAFTNWTLASVAGGGGANPSTDNAITTSKYIVLNFAVGDKFSNLQILEGVIDPTANPELIPN